MEIKRGTAVSPGVVIGPALVLDTEGFRIPQRFVDGQGLDDEIARLRHALAAAASETRDNQQAVSEAQAKSDIEEPLKLRNAIAQTNQVYVSPDTWVTEPEIAAMTAPFHQKSTLAT